MGRDLVEDRRVDFGRAFGHRDVVHVPTVGSGAGVGSNTEANENVIRPAVGGEIETLADPASEVPLVKVASGVQELPSSVEISDVARVSGGKGPVVDEAEDRRGGRRQVDGADQGQALRGMLLP